MSRPLLWMALTAAPALTLPCQGQTGDPSDTSLPADAAAEQRLLELGGDGLGIRRTEHFVIAYDTAEDSLRRLTSRLEATHRSIYRFCKINQIPASLPAARLEVLFFETYEDYGQYATNAGFGYQGSNGFYSQRSNVAAFYNTLNSPELKRINAEIERLDRRIEKLRKSRPVDRQALRKAAAARSRAVNVRDRNVERINRTTVQHEAAHQVLFNALVHVLGAQNPGWLIEGMACLFETPPSASGSGAGTTNQMRLADFRACVGGGNPKGKLKPEDVQVALAAGKFLPLRELVGDAALFTRRKDRNLIHYYSQAWSVVCYLQRTKRQQFAEYLRLLAQRRVGRPLTPEQEIADFESVFGPLDDHFQRRWAAFVLTKLRFKPSELH